MKKLLMMFVVLFPNVVTAAEYHATFFSYQNKKFVANPLHCHTFAVFTESTNGRITRKVAIDWGPANQWRVTQGRVPGHNGDVNLTIRKAVNDSKKEVQSWGPYRTDKTVFDKALKTHQELENHYLYKAADFRSKKDVNLPAVNCITAVKMVLGHHYTGTRMGHEATKEVVKFFEEEGAIHPTQENRQVQSKNEMIFRQLGLDKFPITRN